MPTSQILENLVLTVFGCRIESVPREQQSEVIEQSLNYFLQWLEHYLAEHYSSKEAMRIKAVATYPNSDRIFHKFPELSQQLNEAWQAFFAKQKEYWQAQAA
jgi:phosphopantetheinyl transferase (holo-ACP synthase)